MMIGGVDSHVTTAGKAPGWLGVSHSMVPAVADPTWRE